MDDIVKSYLELLRLVRIKQLGIDSFLYLEKVDDNGGTYDGNAVNRYRLLIALQLDKCMEDEALLVTLFEQEILAHQRNSFQGVFDSLKLNALLLAGFNNIGHLPLFIAASRANFDTQFEFNSRYFLWNGLEASFDYVRGLDKEDKAFFYQKVGNSIDSCLYSDKDITSWKSVIQSIYSPELSFEDFDEEFHFVLDLDEQGVAREMIERWKGLHEFKDASYWRCLVRYYKYLGDSVAVREAEVQLKQCPN